MKTGDLHVHTSASDGMLSPAALALRAAGGALDFIAITDHNSVAGLMQFGNALPPGRLRFIPGVEMTAQPEEGRELHLLGYGVDPECEELGDVCRRVNALKHEQLREMVRRLRLEGIEMPPNVLPPEEDGHYMGRPLLARALVSMGLAQDVNQAFGRYLGEKCPAFTRMGTFGPAHCVEAIHRAGGLAVLAHPTIEIVDQWIRPLESMGLDGVEAYRPSLSGNAQLYVEKAAEFFDLLLTGGSDWHGRENERPLGTFWVTDEQVGTFLSALPDDR